MNWLDMGIIVVILSTTFLGSRIGLLRAAFFLGAIILGILISVRVSATLDKLLEEIIKNPNVRDIVTFTGAFVLIFGAVNYTGSIICKTVGFTPLKLVDRLVGLALGFLAGIMFVGIAIMYLTRFPIYGSEELLAKSLLAPVTRSVASLIFREFMERKPF